MCVPDAFNESRIDVLHRLIRERPLATLVTHPDRGLGANHVPLYLCETARPFGCLGGHIARANPLLEDLRNERDALAVFHGPQAYISPSWYATKKENGNVVPTWNYVVVHARGSLRVMDDAAWLRAQLDALTDQKEAPFAEPWKVSDAPMDYIERLMTRIVGIELIITRLEGKYKLGQNQPSPNRESVVAALGAREDPEAAAMLALIESTLNDQGSER